MTGDDQPSDCFNIPPWVPPPVADAAEALRMHFIDRRDALAVLDRIVSDDRMDMVWKELLKRKRGASTEFFYSAHVPSINSGDDMFQIIAGDLEEFGIGNLADPKIQRELDPRLGEIDFLILDNLSSLTAVIRDNDPESWNSIQAWLLGLRRRGISVLIIHHAGKGGDQRGTSRREDVLDTSISLRRPVDYVPTQGARLEVHIEKGRGIHGDAAKPFEAMLIDTVWTMREIDDVNKARIAALLEDGLSVRDIAEETGISKSTIQRMKKRQEGETKKRDDSE